MTLRQTICVTAALVACAVTIPRPSAQGWYGYCGYILVGGHDSGDELYGYADLVIYNPECEYEYGVETGVAVTAITPWGLSDTRSATVGYVDVFVPMDPQESGEGRVDGLAGVSYFGMPVDYLTDSVIVPVPPPGGSGNGEDPPPEEEEDPPPPPPDITITFSPSDSVTADYNSGDVYITAVVSPAGQGWEQQLYWVGDGEPTGYELERKFSTSQVRNFEVWAVIGTEEEIARVKVVPVVDVSPASPITVPVHPSEYVTLFAQVSPPGEATAEWSGDGWSYPESPHIRYFSRAAAAQFEAVAQAGESKPKPAQVNVVPQPPVLKVVLDEDGNFASGAPTDDSPAFVPGTYYGGASRPVSEIRTTGQIARLIAFFHLPGSPSQIASPPVSSVTISLEDTTAWRGFATNAGWTEDSQNPDPRDSAPDYVLTPVGGGPESSSRVVDFAGNVAVVELRVRDYGGRTRVRADADGQSVTLSLPREDPAASNWIPDGGWWTGPESVADGFAPSDVWSADEDTTSPAAAGAPNIGLQGDGLKIFEEYRGFVVRGVHVRTNPAKKDLFVSSRVTRQDLTQEQSLDFARGSLDAHGSRLHYLFDHMETPAFSEREYSVIGPCNELPTLGGNEECVRLLNFNSVWSGQGPSPPANWSRAQGTLRLMLRTPLTNQASGLMQGGCAQGGTTPAPPAQAWWIFVDVAEIVNDAQAQNQNTNPVVNNEVRRTVGHEIGHGLHVKHRAPPDPGCVLDSANTGSGPSLMNSDWGSGAGAGDVRSRYNDDDVRQMRWHLNAN